MARIKYWDMASQSWKYADQSIGNKGTSITHSWDGTTLIVTSASGTSSANLKGEKGDKGEPGEQGIRGVQGEKGEKGDTGAAGYTPIKGVDYFDGENGKDGQDGFSPTATVEQTTNGAVITITDKNGTTTGTITNGKDGKDGADGISNPLNGKTVAVLGDSISSVAYTVPNYWQMIASKTGCNFLDYGVSGSCFAVRTGSTTSFVERAGNMEDADAVLVMGGTNDVGKGILLGEWASTDNTTLYGALNELISLLRTKYAGKPIVFCTPIKRKQETDSGFPKTIEDLKSATASTDLEMWHCVLAIKAKCAVHGIPVIDLYNDSGIGSGLDEYFRADDGLHPSILGEYRIANMVQPTLEYQFIHADPDTNNDTASYTNLVPTSTDTDGSIYNIVGYKDDVRLSSNGSVSGTAQAGSVTTGFIPFVVSDVIRIKGAEWVDASANYGGHYYLQFYDSNKTNLAGVSSAGLQNFLNAISVVYDETTGVTTFDVVEDYWTAIASAAYFRLNAKGSGSSLIVTVNEEIA